MSFIVTWLPAAEQELAAVWAASARRADVTRAGTQRIAVEPPLAVIFDVNEAARTAAVGRVWEFG